MTRKFAAAVVAAVALCALLVLVLVAALLAPMIEGSTPDDTDCGAPQGAVTAAMAGSGGLPGLTRHQAANARTIVAQGRAMGVSDHGIVVALATARQESGLRNLDHGDRDSLGVFQQRPSQGWGTPQQVQDPVYATRKFYRALLVVPGWELLPVTKAAQAVQRSGHPEAYADDQAAAEGILAALAAPGDVAVKAAQTSAEMPGLRPVARVAAAAVRQEFDFTGVIGGYTPAAKGGHISGSKHYSGLALDVMTPVGPLADRIAAYFAGPGYEPYRVDNVIYNRRIYNAGRGEWGPYGGPGLSPHTTHVHIDFHEAGAVTAPVNAPGAGNVTAAPAVECAEPAAVAPGAVQVPVRGARDNRNFGDSGSRWARGHTGTDFSAACGTPVVAATDGTVQIETGAGWYGSWLVKVTTGPRALTTWYAHMQRVTVPNGSKVTAGDQIGEVGNLGNSTGCHLHFEVHPRNGTIYEDNVDPSVWLARNVGRDRTPEIVPANAPARGTTIVTFNVLGASHTSASGKKPGWASGAARTSGTVARLRAAHADVIGFQEFQTPQVEAFRRIAPEYDLWHPPGDTENAVAWRRSEFSMVAADTLEIPYFNGRQRAMPVVTLRDRSGDVAHVLNVHNPADTRRYPRQGRWRRIAVDREIATVNRLLKTGAPVLVTGDMNDRDEFVCPMVRRTALTPAGSGCNAPRAPIDWILGGNGVTFEGYDAVATAGVSDHKMYVAQVHT